MVAALRCRRDILASQAAVKLRMSVDITQKVEHSRVRCEHYATIREGATKVVSSALSHPVVCADHNEQLHSIGNLL
jgi:hypothetical protein